MKQAPLKRIKELAEEALEEWLPGYHLDETGISHFKIQLVGNNTFRFEHEKHPAATFTINVEVVGA